MHKPLQPQRSTSTCDLPVTSRDPTCSDQVKFRHSVQYTYIPSLGLVEHLVYFKRNVQPGIWTRTISKIHEIRSNFTTNYKYENNQTLHKTYPFPPVNTSILVKYLYNDYNAILDNIFYPQRTNPFSPDLGLCFLSNSRNRKGYVILLTFSLNQILPNHLPFGVYITSIDKDPNFFLITQKTNNHQRQC